jgi:spore coat protein U-like protein
MRPVRTLAAITATTALVASLAPQASAATATANLTVSATVTKNCTVSTSALAFGSYDPVVANASANLDGAGGVTVACTRGATASIALGSGSNAAGSTRRMADGAGNFLTYELYSDSGRSTVWNSGAGALSLTAAPSRAGRDYAVYGRIAGNQDVPAGTYGDTVVATVNF